MLFVCFLVSKGHGCIATKQSALVSTVFTISNIDVNRCQKNQQQYYLKSKILVQDRVKMSIIYPLNLF